MYIRLQRWVCLIQLKYHVKYLDIPTFPLKTKKQYVLSYSIMVKVAQSSDQLTEYLSWTDGHNRRLFTIFGKLRSWQEKSSFKWNCRINGGHICRRETIQYGFIRLCIEYYVLSQSNYKSFSYPVFPLLLKWNLKWKQMYSRSSFTSLTMIISDMCNFGGGR